jgi:hypothetical protein
MITQFTEKNVLSWMRNKAYQYEDGQTGEVNLTALAEAAADAFGQNGLDGPLDDETHWIWEAAARFAS